MRALLIVAVLAGVTVAAPGCDTMDLPEDRFTERTAQTVTRLMQAGWFSVQSDHAERLYSPGCKRR